MTTQPTELNIQRNRASAGVLLIALGVLLFAGQIIRFDHLFLPALGLVFIIAAITQRNSGLMVPGGILLGIGFGSFLTDNVFWAVAEPARGGFFLIGLAAGFASITVLTTIFTRQPHVWALIPATILALIGGALLTGNSAQAILTLLGTYWPVLLILFGVSILFERR